MRKLAGNFLAMIVTDNDKNPLTRDKHLNSSESMFKQ
jgi:hypothetical protein